jgi:hypothetical protein
VVVGADLTAAAWSERAHITSQPQATYHPPVSPSHSAWSPFALLSPSGSSLVFIQRDGRGGCKEQVALDLALEIGSRVGS